MLKLVLLGKGESDVGRLPSPGMGIDVLRGLGAGEVLAIAIWWSRGFVGYAG